MIGTSGDDIQAKEQVMMGVLLAVLAGAGLVMALSTTGDRGAESAARPRRYGSVIGVRAEKLEEYKKLHAAVWPGVLRTIGECNIRNYSIYLRRLEDGQYYLFSYFEYVGSDFEADMKKMAADPTTQEWWAMCGPCQKPLSDRKDGEWWAGMEEVFHTD